MIYFDRDEYRPCRNCGQLTDSGVCSPECAIELDRKSAVTHIIPCNARAVVRNEFRALCGTKVFGHQHVSANPSCPECKRIDDEEAEHLRALYARSPAPKPVMRQL